MEVIQKFWRVYNESAFELLDEILTSTYTAHVNASEIQGIDGAKKFIGAFKTAFPDAKFTVQDLIVSGDKAVTRWTATATHQNTFAGIEATFKPVQMTGITIFYLENGKIRELWGNWDVFSVIQQLNA